MNVTRVIIGGAAVAAAALLIACSGDDAGSLDGLSSSGDPGSSGGAATNDPSPPTSYDAGGGQSSGNGGGSGGGGGGGAVDAGGGGATDAGGGGAMDAAGDARDASDASDAAHNCINGVPVPGSGHHNAGQDCIGCHQNISGAQWTVAGTLYSAANGGGAIAGATIEIVDANGKTLKLATYQNGNFYTTSSVAFPLTVRASKCPNDAKMSATTQDGSCNTCHSSGMRIHLP